MTISDVSFFQAREAREETRKQTESGAFRVFTSLGNAMDKIVNGLISVTDTVTSAASAGVQVVGRWFRWNGGPIFSCPFSSELIVNK